MTPPRTKIGRGNSLLYALVVSLFLAWQSVDISRTRDSGWEFRSKHVPVEILAPCLLFLGLALGVNVSESIVAIALAVSRNSLAINALLSKNNISPTTLESTETEVLDEKDNERS